jgi:translation elongation factor P/translation initiation factor 5A
MAANDLRKGMLIEQDGGKRLLEVQEAFHSAGLARQGGFVSLDCRYVARTLLSSTA